MHRGVRSIVHGAGAGRRVRSMVHRTSRVPCPWNSSLVLLQGSMNTRTAAEH